MFNIRTKISIIWQHAKYSLCFYAPKQQALTSCTIHPNAILHSRVIRTNDINHLRAICPNETVGADIRAQFSQAKYVGAAPACPPERSRSGVSIQKTHILCAGNERWIRPCRTTRAGTQAPPLPFLVWLRVLRLAEEALPTD